MTTYAELIDAKTAETLRTELLDRLEQEGFPITAWQAGNTARTLVAVDVQTLAELYGIVAQIGKGWSLDDSEGPWLTLHAWSRYRVARTLATFARHVVRLTVASGAGPYTITPGQLVLSRGSLRYRSTNSANVALAYGSPVDVTVQCESSGVAGNAQPTAVVTPALAGVTMAWQSLDLSARDEETDPELRQRCRDKWATLAEGQGPQAAYRYWLTTAVDGSGDSCGITRVAFGTIPGDGTVPIWVAGASGAIGAPQLAAAQDYVSERRPLTDTPGIQNATEASIDVSAMTVRFKPGKNTLPNQAAVRAGIVSTINGLDISTADDPVIVDEAAIKAAVYAAAPGLVRDVDWTGTDSTLAAGAVAVASGASSITFSE